MKNDFEADVENVLACPNNEKLSSPLRNLRVYRYNRTQLSVNYDFNYHRPLDEKVGGAVIVERWGDGGWIKIPFVGYQRNICDRMLKNFRQLWIDIYSKAGVKDPSKCPIPAMKNDFEADVENILACPNNEKLSSPLRNLRVNRYNRTVLLVNYDFTFHRPLDEKVGGAIIVERWGDGGWIKIPFLGFQRNICDTMVKKFGKLWTDFYSKAGVKDPSKCPIPPMKNDFEADVENVLACPNNEKLSSPLRNLRVNRYNRTVLLVNYDFTFHRPLDEKVGGAIIVERWGDGGWIRIPFLGFQRNICDTMVKKFGKLWTDIYSKAGVKDPSKCPIPPGNYSVRNFAFQTIKMPIPFWSGRFRFTTMFQDVDTKEDIYCIICIITITEKY